MNFDEFLTKLEAGDVSHVDFGCHQDFKSAPVVVDSVDQEEIVRLCDSFKRPSQLSSMRLFKLFPILPADFLLAISSLTELWIWEIQITYDGAKALAQTLLNPKCLITTLSLRWNKIGAKGGQIICESLKNNHTLKNLRLSDNDLGPAGGSAMGEGLECNKTLTKLNFSRNGIGPTGAEAIGKGLEHNHTLICLE
eukprot:m.3431 g.3431  ORF g.3431 m.3431 type:complete len:195 (-) comp3977_c0_seq1:112-696(-)